MAAGIAPWWEDLPPTIMWPGFDSGPVPYVGRVCGGRKTREPRENPSDQGKNQQQNQPTFGTGPESNPDHIGKRRALSPPRHPCSTYHDQTITMMMKLKGCPMYPICKLIWCGSVYLRLVEKCEAVTWVTTQSNALRNKTSLNIVSITLQGNAGLPGKNGAAWAKGNVKTLVCEIFCSLHVKCDRLYFVWMWKDFGNYTWCVKRPNCQFFLKWYWPNFYP